MYEVVKAESLTPDVRRLVVEAPRVARARRPGQFVIVRRAEGAERIPLTIADADPDAGTITLIVQAAGISTRQIAATEEGEALRDVVGPLGKPTAIRKWGRVACVGGGVGTAVLFPQAKALAEAGNDVVAIVGARSEADLILRDELARFCREVRITTEDGSAGTRGFVTAELSRLLDDAAGRPEAVFAVGPVPMMAAVAEMTRPHGIETIVSLNPIMVDGTGMCGGCRVTVGGETRFACVDGPEFNAHAVDFRELASRQATYQEDYCRLRERTAGRRPGRADEMESESTS